jgi:hypothetical protein
VAQVNEKLGEDKKKAAAKPKKETKKATPQKKAKAPLIFPADIRVNAYGFIGIRKPLLEALSWHKGEKLTIEKNADGSATVRKA